MPLATCNQNEFLIEPKLNGFWGVFCYIWLDFFLGERGDEVK